MTEYAKMDYFCMKSKSFLLKHIKNMIFSPKIHTFTVYLSEKHLFFTEKSGLCFSSGRKKRKSFLDLFPK